LTTSTSFIIGTGLKKCRPPNLTFSSDREIQRRRRKKEQRKRDRKKERKKKREKQCVLGASLRLAVGGQREDGEGRRVGDEDSARRRLAIQLLEKRLLHFEVLHDGFDQQVGVRDGLLGADRRANVGEALGDELLALLRSRVLLLGDSLQVLRVRKKSGNQIIVT
jgi:hypothetical protein